MRPIARLDDCDAASLARLDELGRDTVTDAIGDEFARWMPEGEWRLVKVQLAGEHAVVELEAGGTPGVAIVSRADSALQTMAITATPFLTGRYEQALSYALAHHAHHLRKGTTVPYVAHLLAVSSLVLEMDTGSEDEAIAALLHDVVEDGGGMQAAGQIAQRFGADVLRIVLANSDSSTEEKADWTTRKRAYVGAIAHKAPDELRVSLADKLHNARAILFDHQRHGDALWSRFKTGESASVIGYYRALADAFAARVDALGPGGAAAAEELDRVVKAIEHRAGAGTPLMPGRS